MKRLSLLLSLLFAFWGAALAAVNVNTATRQELEALKGIGPVKAQAIIDYRTKNGPFKSVDDLANVKGIGPKTLEDLRDELGIRGATTAAKRATPPAKPEVASPASPAVPAKATEAPKTQVPRTAAANAESRKKDGAPAAKGRKAKADTKVGG